MFVPGATIAIFGCALVLMNFGVDQLSNPRLIKPKKRKKVKHSVNTKEVKENVYN
jgi:hypothetical protein